MTAVRLTPEELNSLLAAALAYPETSSFDFPLANLLAENPDSRFEAVTFQPGELIFEEHEPGGKIYYIFSGRVVILKGDFSQPKLLGVRGPGEIIGEMALLENRPRSASVVALDTTHLFGASRQDFFRLISGNESIGVSTLKTLSSRLRASDEDRLATKISAQQLTQQVSDLEGENRHLLELHRLREETSDLIIHDLRNPLGAIYIALRMLETSMPPEMQAEYGEIVNVAASSCSRMQRLVDSLLEVSRMDAGEADLQFSEFDLAQVITSLVANVRMLKKLVHIQLDLPADGLVVQADRDKIERVLANLLDNALKHTPSGGSVTISARPGPTGVEVSMADTGPGIPEDQRQRIFERFSQVQHEKNKRRGFGLGLTYCRLAVEMHGGRIWVEPGPDGLGSRFAFTVPQAGLSVP